MAAKIMTDVDHPVKRSLRPHMSSQNLLKTTRVSSISAEPPFLPHRGFKDTNSFTLLLDVPKNGIRQGNLPEISTHFTGNSVIGVTSRHLPSLTPRASKTDLFPSKSPTDLQSLRPVTGSKGHIQPESKSVKRTFPCMQTIPPFSAIEQEGMGKKQALSILQGLKIGRTLPSVDAGTLIMKKLTIPRKPGCEGKKTLIFDLDETLIHCVTGDIGMADIRLPISLQSGMTAVAGINIRPYALECLTAASALFEVMVFTASQKPYADAVLNLLDPTHSLIHYRLYRENCISIRKYFLKDLRILTGRDLSEVVIVDNSILSFINHLDNGIPISTWTNDPTDRDLLHLIHFLPTLAQAKDVREVLRTTFRLKQVLSDLDNYQV